MNEYSSGDLMAAIRSLQDATALGFARTDAKIDSEVAGLRHEMNRRFDNVDRRFDEIDRRFERLEHPERR
jgi:hypothetical protein